jgi:hypothetical protein
MDIFYPEYAALIIFFLVASWRILKDAPEEGKSRDRRFDRTRMPETGKAKAKEKVKRSFRGF